jgi:hypothetical protein
MDRIDLNTLPPHAFVIMTIYFLQTLKVLPYLDEEIQNEKDKISVESDNFDYNVFETKLKSYVFIFYCFFTKSMYLF